MDTQLNEAIGFMRLQTVLNLIPISKTSFYAGVREGLYPAPIKIGKRTSVWRVSDIHQLIEDLGSSK